jgi:hypothetical protein
MQGRLKNLGEIEAPIYPDAELDEFERSRLA